MHEVHVKYYVVQFRETYYVRHSMDDVIFGVATPTAGGWIFR